jgi:hypothetical protein
MKPAMKPDNAARITGALCIALSAVILGATSDEWSLLAGIPLILGTCLGVKQP